MSETLRMRRVVAGTALMLGVGALAGCGGGSQNTDKPIKSEAGICDGLDNTVGQGTGQEICFPKKNLRVVLITNPNGTSIILNEMCEGTTLQIKQERPDGARKVLAPPTQEDMPVCEDGVLAPNDYHGFNQNALY